MLSRVRTYLDEASASYWSDTEVYRALTDGQNEVINIGLKAFDASLIVPRILQEMVSAESKTIGSNGYTAFPTSEYLRFVSFEITSGGSIIPANYLSRLQYNDVRDNYYMQPSDDNPAVIIEDNSGTPNLKVIPTDTYETDGLEINYIKKPSDIASGTDPTVADIAHVAIVQYAFSALLQKDGFISEATNEYKKFTSMASRLI